VGDPVGVAVGVPVGVSLGVGVGDPEGVGVEVDNVNDREQAFSAALGMLVGAVGATACCLN
jgi:hypothetical protein